MSEDRESRFADSSRSDDRSALIDQRACPVVGGVSSTCSAALGGGGLIGELDMVLAGPPDLLLLDEPAAGLSHDETTRLARRIRAVAAAGRCGVVVVEHDMELVRELADRVVVLSDGEVIADGSMDEIVAHDAVRAAYLGVV